MNKAVAAEEPRAYLGEEAAVPTDGAEITAVNSGRNAEMDMAQVMESLECPD